MNRWAMTIEIHQSGGAVSVLTFSDEAHDLEDAKRAATLIRVGIHTRHDVTYTKIVGLCREPSVPAAEMAADDCRKQITGMFEAALKALKFARPMVAAELKLREAMYTVGGDYSTLSEEDGGACGEALACLAQIDAVINGKDMP